MDIPEIILLTVAAWSSGYLDIFDFWNTVMRLVVYFSFPVVVIIQSKITSSFGQFIELPFSPQLSLPVAFNELLSGIQLFRQRSSKKA